MSETLKVAYWNMLDSIPPQEEGLLLDYYHAIHDVYQPDVLFLTECRRAIVNELAPNRAQRRAAERESRRRGSY
jgi:hypothetical protein